MTYIHSDRPVFDERSYFVCFLGFVCAFGLCGLGGVFNIARNRSSVRFSAVLRGSKSSSSRSLVAGGFAALFMAEPHYG